MAPLGQQPHILAFEPICGRLQGAVGLIEGVRRIALQPQSDQRGVLVPSYLEIGDDPAPAQWNLVRSAAGVTRGVHAHAHYDEYYLPVSGRMFFALKDARRGAPSFGSVMSFWTEDGEPVAITVPRGVAHSVAFPDGGLLFYGLSCPWTGEAEFACRWNDPDLGIEWPIARPLLSDRDAVSGAYGAMVAGLNEALDAAAVP